MKYALIIGNNQYYDPKLAQLKTPAADAQALAEVLKDQRIGSFDEVIPLVNKTEFQVSRAISTFLTNKKPEDLILVYFSGHGVLDDRGRLFLALKDTQTSLLKATAISSSFIVDEMDSCRSKRQILILDCCHSGAFGRGVKGGEQKAVTETTFEGSGFGRVVLTASDSTQYALEGNQVIKQTELSLFTHFLLEGLKTGEADANNDGYISLDEWYDYTYSQVLSTTPRQVPHKWSYHQQGDLILAKNPYVKKVAELPAELASLRKKPIPERPPRQPNTAIIVALIGFAGIIIAGLLSSPLLARWFAPVHFPTQMAIATTTFSLQPITPSHTLEPSPTRTEIFTSSATPLPTEITDTKEVPMRLVSAGQFTMGSNNGDSDEKPIHTIRLSAFYIDKYEVTNALYMDCVNSGVCQPPKSLSSSTRSNYYGNLEFDKYPVIFVDWDMAKTYCETWRGGMIPTEAQWEKAARGTDERIYPWGEAIDKTYANYDTSDTTAVGSFESNVSPYGIYDMAGNVWEWVADWYSRTYYGTLFDGALDPRGPDGGPSHVLRGGSWVNNDYRVRSTDRGFFEPGDFYYVGFRCSRNAKP